jgi:hypothetical protein
LSGEFHTVYSKALYFDITHHSLAILTKESFRKSIK